MEEDRDRQKRSREFAWIRGGPENIESPTAPTYDQEFLDAWEKAQPLTPAVEKQFKKYDEEFIYLVTADDHPKQINDNLQY